MSEIILEEDFLIAAKVNAHLGWKSEAETCLAQAKELRLESNLREYAHEISEAMRKYSEVMDAAFYGMALEVLRKIKGDGLLNMPS